MKPLIIRSPRHFPGGHHPERGVTMILVAVAMVAIIGMAIMSIDVVTLYLAREEAQRSADAAALAAARIISISGITGTATTATDASSWQNVCGTSGTATKIAQAVGTQSSVGRSAPTVTVQYTVKGSDSGGSTDCSTLTAGFAVNPSVIVQVKSVNLPTLFSRVWSRATNTVSATAVAEAYNPSNAGTFTTGDAVPVTPRCVKPWIVPNHEPGKALFVSVLDGTATIQNPGIQPNGTGNGGVIGETFALVADCKTVNCKHPGGLKNNPPISPGANTLEYVPALVQGTPTAFPTCANDDVYQEAIGGCDQSTVYACGTASGSQVDLTFNPTGDTSEATQCLIRQQGGTGQDQLDPSVFPFQIKAGSRNPLITSGVITSSSSIVTVPIYDDNNSTSSPVPFTVDQPQVTIVGFLQVFVNSVVAGSGDVNVTVLNVAGCSTTDGSTTQSAAGTSPVPIRLITAQ
jgi:Flp pilus assembly protein TadG